MTGSAPAANPPGQKGQSTGCTFRNWSALRNAVTRAEPSTSADHFISSRSVSPVGRRVSLPVRLRSKLAGNVAVTVTGAAQFGVSSSK